MTSTDFPSFFYYSFEIARLSKNNYFLDDSIVLVFHEKSGIRRSEFKVVLFEHRMKIFERRKMFLCERIISSWNHLLVSLIIDSFKLNIIKLLLKFYQKIIESLSLIVQIFPTNLKVFFLKSTRNWIIGGNFCKTIQYLNLSWHQRKKKTNDH